jgi:uncharacterized protein
MSDIKSFLGTGWCFPPSFDNEGEKLLLVSGYDDIAESIIILLGTIQGERVMQPNYGCNMDELVFESIDTSMITFLKDKIAASILYHESRINLLDITINDDQVNEGILQIEIVYEVRGTNSRMNLVYPFYLTNITNL